VLDFIGDRFPSSRARKRRTGKLTVNAIDSGLAKEAERAPMFAVSTVRTGDVKAVFAKPGDAECPF
jgi:hypothetical protein